MHDYIGFALTVGLIIAGILFNRQDFRELRLEMTRYYVRKS